MALVRPEGFVDRARDPHHDVIVASEAETTFRHGGWKNLRAKVRNAMVAAHLPVSRIERFDNCGGHAWLWCQEEDGTPIIRSSHCHDRYCLPCAAARAHRIAQTLVKKVEERKTLHVVLTIASTNDSLHVQVKRLLKSFTALRRRPFWKKRVLGGYHALEVTANERDGRWHPHLHILCHADWLPQADLSREWLATTKDSKIVHVSLVQRTENAVREVTKYVTKPLHGSVTSDPNKLVELIRCLNGVHTTSTFGTWRGTELLPEPTAEERAGWRPICSLHDLLQRAAKGDTWALHTLEAVQRRNVRNDCAPQLPLFSSA